MAINLSRSISIEMNESFSRFPSISSLFCLFRFGVGRSAELELDERSEPFDMSTSSEQQILSYTPCIEVKRHHWLHLNERKRPGLALLNYGITERREHVCRP